MPNSSAQLVQADAGVFMDTSVGYILCKYVLAFTSPMLSYSYNIIIINEKVCILKNFKHFSL